MSISVIPIHGTACKLKSFNKLQIFMMCNVHQFDPHGTACKLKRLKKIWIFMKSCPFMWSVWSPWNCMQGTFRNLQEASFLFPFHLTFDLDLFYKFLKTLRAQKIELKVNTCLYDSKISLILQQPKGRPLVTPWKFLGTWLLPILEIMDCSQKVRVKRYI